MTSFVTDYRYNYNIYKTSINKKQTSQKHFLLHCWGNTQYNGLASHLGRIAMVLAASCEESECKSLLSMRAITCSTCYSWVWLMDPWCCIPANLFSVKCVRFFVSTESEFPKIYQRLPKIAEGFQRLPKIFWQLLTITEGVERFRWLQNRAGNDFQRISNQSRALLKGSEDVHPRKPRGY